MTIGGAPVPGTLADTRRGRRWLWAVLTAVLVLGILAGSAGEVVSLEQSGAASLRSEVSLARLNLYVESVRYFGQRFATGAALYPGALQTERWLISQAEMRAAQIPNAGDLGASLRTEVEQLAQMAGTEFSLVGGHELAAATQLDAGPITATFDRYVSTESSVDTMLSTAAHHAENRSRIGIVATIVGAGLLLVTILTGFELSRRRSIRARASETARRSEAERFRILVQNSSDVVTVVDEHGFVSWQAPSVRAVLGLDPGEIVGTDFGAVVHPEDLYRFRVLCGDDSGRREDIRIRHFAGGYRSCEIRAAHLLDEPQIRGIVLNIRDLTERVSLEEELRHQAFHDSLTGLANRGLFADRVEHALARQSRTGEPIAILVIDLDDFKSVNDSLGHGVGDHLLTEVANRLVAVVRAADTVARLGGDEFAVLLEAPAEGEGPEVVANRLRSALAEPISLDGRNLVVSASVGATVSTDKLSTAEELLRNADVAMYVAKSRGRGLWAMFEAGMQISVQQRLALKTDLFEAVGAGDQMELHYQPVVDLATRSIVGLEALVRWNHPTRGLIPPLEFIPLAEDAGLIVPLGAWVLREALTQLSVWRGRHPHLARVAMSVNVSACQLRDPQFVEHVRRALEDTGVDAESLILEITESVLIRESDGVVDTLHQVKALDVRLAIDDFGTGYSSLGYLQSFPVDILKVDRSFTSALTADSRQSALAEAIVNIGSSLNLATIAEGIEEEGQVPRLRAMQCSLGQGYLFAKPLPATFCEEILAASTPPDRPAPMPASQRFIAASD